MKINGGQLEIENVFSGFTKKVEALAKEKGCEDVRGWIKSISNHMYWCAASSEDQPGDLVVAKWQSIAHHVQNIHTGHGKLFPRCQHDDLSVCRTKKWLQPSKFPKCHLSVLIGLDRTAQFFILSHYWKKKPISILFQAQKHARSSGNW